MPIPNPQGLTDLFNRFYDKVSPYLPSENDVNAALDGYDQATKGIPNPLQFGDEAVRLGVIGGFGAARQLSKLRLSELIKQLDKGIGYHGTTLPQAKSIISKGFNPLNIKEEIQRVADIYKVDLSSISKYKQNSLNRLIESYSSQEGEVSTTPYKNIAARWAGSGGEIAKDVERILIKDDLKAWRHPKSKLTDIPAIIELELNRANPRINTRIQREITNLESLLQEINNYHDFDPTKGGYIDIRAYPQDIKPIKIIPVD
jgi:hypothetical protein